MTLDDAMKQYSGEWNAEGFAVIQYKDGYYWRIAKKNGNAVEITSDGLRILGPQTLANTSTDKVESPKKAAKKPAKADEIDDLDL
jgi:hypothetical protein